MDIRSVERAIVLSYIKPDKYRPLKGYFFFSALGLLSITVLVLLIGFLFTGIATDGDNINLTSLVIVATLLLITSISAILQGRKAIKNTPSEVTPDSESKPEDNKKKWSSIGSIATALGIVFAMLYLPQHPEAGNIMLFVGMIFLAVLFLFFATDKLHMLYLLARYCPYLKTADDARYYKPNKEDDDASK